MDIPRLNGVIKALEAGQPAFVPFSPAEVGAALTIASAPYDGVVFEMEHNPYDIKALRDCMQYMLSRRQIATSGSIAPSCLRTTFKLNKKISADRTSTKTAALKRGCSGILFCQ